MSAIRTYRQRTIRVFAAGAGIGLVLGALIAVLMVWQFGALPHGTAEFAPGPSPREVGDHTASIRIDGDGPPAATTGVRRPEPESMGSAVIGPEPSAPHELAERDLVMPVEGVGPSQLTRQFTDTRGDSRPHEALDIPAPRHTPVRAVEDGRIARLFISKAGGITIYQFDPTERFCYYYAHLERYADGLREGDMVRKGQAIGYVGTSGNAPEDVPHLHFAIFRLTAEKRWWEGVPIDPYDVLR